MDEAEAPEADVHLAAPAVAVLKALSASRISDDHLSRLITPHLLAHRDDRGGSFGNHQTHGDQRRKSGSLQQVASQRLSCGRLAHRKFKNEKPKQTKSNSP